MSEMTGWALAGVITLAFMLGCCFGVMITALMCANGRDKDDRP